MQPRSIADAVAAQRAGQLTAEELLDGALRATSDLGDSLGAIVLTDPTAAEVAKRADQARAEGRWLGPLHGVPVAVKDIIDMAGLPTRCGSPTYSEAPARADAPVVARLRKAGAVVFAKTVAHELACGVYSSPAANPWDPDRIPGGSSGGSGAAVAAGLTLLALGSDTGGSIRIPASLCGVAGMKPTYGLVPKSGVEPLAWSLDHIGPLARTVADCAVALDAIGGVDRSDPSCLAVPPPSFASELGAPVVGLRVGIVRNHFHEPISGDVAAAFDAAIGTLAELGCEIVDVEIPELVHTLATEFGIVGAEAAACHRARLADVPDLIDPSIRALLVAGRLLPADHYLKALTARARIQAAVKGCFAAHRLDVVATPQLPATAARKDQLTITFPTAEEDVTGAYVRTTAPFNLTGQPALTVPCGFDTAGLPIGMQLAGRPLADATVLRVRQAYEHATDWHLRRPPLHAAI